MSQQRLARRGEHLRGQGTEPYQVVGRKTPLAEAPHGDGHPGTSRRDADGDTGAVFQACVHDGLLRRVQAQGPRNMNGGAGQRPLIERGSRVGLEFSGAFDPDVVRAVDHDLAHVRVRQHGFQSRQERLEVFEATGPAHSCPSLSCRQ